MNNVLGSGTVALSVSVTKLKDSPNIKLSPVAHCRFNLPNKSGPLNKSENDAVTSKSDESNVRPGPEPGVWSPSPTTGASGLYPLMVSK